MKKNQLYFFLTIAFMITLLTTGCDTEGEETMSWKSGTSLHIVGPDAVEIGEEAEYYVDGYTVEETYTWTLDGSPVTPARNGEFVNLQFDAAETHVLTVSNGAYDGSLDITVE